MTTDQKRLESLAARAAMQGLELMPANDPAPGWAVSNWFMSRFFDNLNALENYLNHRTGGKQ